MLFDKAAELENRVFLITSAPSYANAKAGTACFLKWSVRWWRASGMAWCQHRWPCSGGLSEKSALCPHSAGISEQHLCALESRVQGLCKPAEEKGLPAKKASLCAEYDNMPFWIMHIPNRDTVALCQLWQGMVYLQVLSWAACEPPIKIC